MINYITQPQKSQSEIQELSKRKAQQKKYAPLIAQAIKENTHIAQSTAESIYTCGTYIAMHGGKITAANFCKNRYCPICQWRASRKIYGQTRQIYDTIATEKSKFALLTLTIRNTHALKAGLQACFDGLKRFTNTDKFKRAQQGYMRTLEITYNEKTSSWHPHIHMLLHLHDDYFNDEKRYLTQSDYIDMWRRSVKDNCITQVDIRLVKGDIAKAIAEVAKYAIKPSSVLHSGAEQSTVTELISSTYRRRLRSFGGSFKNAAHALGIQAEPNEDLQPPSPEDDIYIYKNGTYIHIKDNAPQNHQIICNALENERKKTQQTCNCCTNDEKLAGGGAL